MAISTVIVIALIVGAIAFSFGLIAGILYTNRQYIRHAVKVETPSYVTDNAIRKMLSEQLETYIIIENIAEHEDNGEIKSIGLTFYTNKNGK